MPSLNHLIASIRPGPYQHPRETTQHRLFEVIIYVRISDPSAIQSPTPSDTRVKSASVHSPSTKSAHEMLCSSSRLLSKSRGNLRHVLVCETNRVQREVLSSERSFPGLVTRAWAWALRLGTHPLWWYRALYGELACADLPGAVERDRSRGTVQDGRAEEEPRSKNGSTRGSRERAILCWGIRLFGTDDGSLVVLVGFHNIRTALEKIAGGKSAQITGVACMHRAQKGCTSSLRLEDATLIT
jgi:hypothetical protein